MDALTLMGEYLRLAPKNQGARGTGNNQHKKEVRFPDGTAPQTLADLGISKKESANAQALATMAQEPRQRSVSGYHRAGEGSSRGRCAARRSRGRGDGAARAGLGWPSSPLSRRSWRT